jgi:hypothetical protein
MGTGSAPWRYRVAWTILSQMIEIIVIAFYVLIIVGGFCALILSGRISEDERENRDD